MQRRAFLFATAATAATVGVAGCLERTATAYEPCPESVLVYAKLPEAVQDEIDEAMAAGTYETTAFLVTNEFLYETVAARSADVLRKDGTYYEARITEASVWLGFGTKRTLSFTAVTLEREEPKELLLRNTTADPWTGAVIVDDTNGDRVLSERVTVEPYPRDETPGNVPADEIDWGRLARVPVTDEYGRYDVTLEPDDGESVTVDFWVTMGYPPRRDRYAITDGGVEYDETLYGAIPRPGHPRQSCSWDEDGALY
ncbi:hypothetical protein [Halopiger xanaduensis]|uniref:hypothetical protein n=1 Tax=Halopiger xanaduensis TaxID=387343 RepID=UPI000677C880|nr:hypothetical protein [Halopiger xanaduensis]